MLSFLLIVGVGVVALYIWSARKIAHKEAAKRGAMSPQELQVYDRTLKMLADAKQERRRVASETYNYGNVNPAMICPHCNTRGKIRTKSVVNKRGVSGGKATAAVLTGGVSLLATGLSRKEQATQAWCGACRNTWSF